MFLGCQQLPCLGWNITLLCRGIIGQIFITGSIWVAFHYVQIVIVIGAWIKCIKVINLKSNHQAPAVVQRVDGPVGWKKCYAQDSSKGFHSASLYPLFSDLSAGWPYSMDKSFLAGKAIRKTRFPLFCKAGLFICC